jgi:Protein of unknown function (DUF3017)
VRKYTAERAVRKEKDAGNAVPQIGGRAVKHSAPARRRRPAQFPYWIIACCVALALASTRLGGDSVRGGTLAVAGILLAGALARLVLPERSAGMLVSRRRLADVAVLGALGAGLLVAGLVLPAQS